MGLAAFIRTEQERILAEWESFARTLRPAAEGLTAKELRDHGRGLLQAIAADMESSETPAEETAKSTGHKSAGRLGAVGKLHAILRAEGGFKLEQVLAEYRALRASVLRLWTDWGDDQAAVLRFNEAIDEALTEAVRRYTERMDRYRDEVIAIVSHDLRNPLGAIVFGAAALSLSETLDDKGARIASRIESSAKRMTRLVTDLLVLTRTRLGSPVPLVPKPTDLDALCELVIAELHAVHPDAAIRYLREGDLRGEWDADRLAQVLSNLVGNALQHGEPRDGIDVSARSDGDHVVVAIHNTGTIP